MPSSHVVVVVDQPSEVGVAVALAAEPSLSSLGLLGGNVPTVWKDRIKPADSVGSYDLVVGVGTKAGQLAVEAGLPAVLGSLPTDTSSPTLFRASVDGLALSLLAQNPHGKVVVTSPNSKKRRSRNGSVVFPPPIGTVATTGPDRVGIFRAPIEDDDCVGVLLLGDGRSEAWVDQSNFFRNACLAAGAMLWLESSGFSDTVNPVWAEPERFLSWCRRFGLVSAEAT